MAETVDIDCAGCGVRIQVEEDYYTELAGTTIQCPECNADIEVPAREAPRKKARIVVAKKTNRKKCVKCDKAIRVRSSTCPFCGTNQTSGEEDMTRFLPRHLRRGQTIEQRAARRRIRRKR